MLPGMSARNSAKPHIAIVGAGNLASALAVSLHKAGYVIEQIIARSDAASLSWARRLAREVGTSAVTAGRVKIRAEIVWFCVPDGAIDAAAKSLVEATDWSGKIALHSSGALTSDELAVLRKQGASVASVHPLMTFVRGSRPALDGVPYAIEGDSIAVRTARAIVRDLRGQSFTIRKKHKAAYHAWGTFASPLLTSLLAAGERVAVAAGVNRKAARERMLPILRQTLANYARLGGAKSFSGPIPRGDAATVRKHLEVLGKVPRAREVYITLTRAAMRDLPARNRATLEKILRLE
jgi:predicted short-subunit dehydrogenase-like oxidoreductase (DUF2520 family)